MLLMDTSLSSAWAEDAVYQSVETLNQSGLEGQVIHGTVPARTTDWPATLYANVDDHSHCTATIVGPHVILTAAHCLPPSGKFTAIVHQIAYHATCTKPDGWPNDPSDDYALCSTDGDAIPVVYEMISFNPKAVALGVKITLAGYGCSDQYQNGAGTFRIGYAPVVRMPNVPDKTYVFDRNSVVTQGAAICPGDSGGGAFLETPTAAGTYRAIVGVNSRVDMSKLTSYLSATFSPDGRAFFQSWSKEKSAQICGLGAVQGCRN
ncbi:trypsin-like serine protease [Agrobacterium vitis]|uniref:Peptidase S1 (Chymotrypsin) family protein n=4 Tax=Rhizobium/Agrobacterium group TaxID=227290 RepID=B9JRL9_ALLAM|nr:peptidase S1 (chymotrypsin) family protein [Allorhizobium ampelinum S4]MUO29577.1 trypsin-like serine protease [Agrobacterium vitis]MUP13144.1 trypsin-like serine protease [Agrobacterium vitis]